LRLPAAFAAWMAVILSNYTKYAEAAEREVDQDLLDQIQENLAEINRQD
jgi:hypothetical protein